MTRSKQVNGQAIITLWDNEEAQTAVISKGSTEYCSLVNLQGPALKGHTTGASGMQGKYRWNYMESNSNQQWDTVRFMEEPTMWQLVRQPRCTVL